MATFSGATGGANTNNQTSYTTGSFNAVVNDLLVVAVLVTGNTDAGTVTDSQGYSYTKISSTTKNAGADTLHLFVANGLIELPVSMTVTFSCPSGASGAYIYVARLAGMTRVGLNSVLQVASAANQTGGGTPAATFASAALTGNATLVMVANASNPAALTPPTNWTEYVDGGYATPTAGLELAVRNSGFTGSTITWGNASATDYCVLIAEFDNTSKADADGFVSQLTAEVVLSTPSNAVVTQVVVEVVRRNPNKVDTLTAPLLTNATVLYEPTVSQSGSVINLNPPLLASANVLYEPEVVIPPGQAERKSGFFFIL